MPLVAVALAGLSIMQSLRTSGGESQDSSPPSRFIIIIVLLGMGEERSARVAP